MIVDNVLLGYIFLQSNPHLYLNVFFTLNVTNTSSLTEAFSNNIRNKNDPKNKYLKATKNRIGTNWGFIAYA